MILQLKIDIMSMDDANRLLNRDEKELWVKKHNKTANLYCIIHGEIKEVPPHRDGGIN